MLIGLDMRSAGVPTKPVAVVNPTTGQAEVHTLTTSFGPSSGLSILDTNSTTGERINYTAKPTVFGGKPTLMATSSLFPGRSTPVPAIPPHVAEAIVPPPPSTTGQAVPDRAPDPSAPPPAGSMVLGAGDGAILDMAATDQARINAQTFYASEKRQAEMTIAGGVALGGVGYFKQSWLIGVAGAVVALFGAQRLKRASDTYQAQQATFSAQMIQQLRAGQP